MFAILIGTIKGSFSWNILTECGREAVKSFIWRRLKFRFQMEQIGPFLLRHACAVTWVTNMADASVLIKFATDKYSKRCTNYFIIVGKLI